MLDLHPIARLLIGAGIALLVAGVITQVVARWLPPLPIG